MKEQNTVSATNKDNSITDEQKAQFVKDLRVEMDKGMKAIESLSKEQRSREVSSAYTALQLSRMRLGKVLFLFPKEEGYVKDGKRKDASDIEPPLHTSSKDVSLTGNNRTEKIDKLRQYLKKNIEQPLEEKESVVFKGNKAKFSHSVTLMALQDSIMWLGAELGRIYKDNQKS